MSGLLRECDRCKRHRGGNAQARFLRRAEISGVQDARESNVGGAAPSSGSVAGEPRVAATAGADGLSSGRGKPTMTDVARIAGVSQSSVSLMLNRNGRRADFGGHARNAWSRPRARSATNCLRRAGAPVTALDRNVDRLSRRRNLDQPASGRQSSTARATRAGKAGSSSPRTSRARIPSSKPSTIDAIRRDPHVIGVIYSTIFTRKVSLPDAASIDLPTVLLNCYSADRRVPSIVPGEVAGALHATRISPRQGTSPHRLHQRRTLDGRLGRSAEGLPTGARPPPISRSIPVWCATATGCRCKATICHALELLAQIGRSADRDFLRQRSDGDGRARGGGAAWVFGFPQDLSIMGYDDQELARYTHPPLSTLVLPNYEMGRKATEVLIDLAIHKKASRPMTLEIDGPLIERYSVGDCPSR